MVTIQPIVTIPSTYEVSLSATTLVHLGAALHTAPGLAVEVSAEVLHPVIA